MRDHKEVQLAWIIVELLETLSEHIWEYYQDDFRRDIKENEHRNVNEPWKD
jgi:hypothetical protein